MLKQSVGKLRDNLQARRIGMSPRLQLCRRGCATMQTNRKVIVTDTIHDTMSKLWQKGASGGKLTDMVQARSRTICCRINITAPEKEGTDKFEFRNAYKSQGGIR